ncbi:MAG: cytochrome c [Hyphomicrobiaceae bacterium]
MSIDPKVLLRPLAVAVIATLPTFAFAEATDTETLVAAGRLILSEQCSRCHAVDREGASPLAAAPPFRTLSRKYPLDSLAEALAEGITTGHPDMPEFVFSSDEIAAILAYIESISPPPARK